MLPEPLPELIEQRTVDSFMHPRDKNYVLTESWDLGGVDFNNTSADLDSYTWFAWTDGNTIFIKREDLDTVTSLITDESISEIDITFDQNMRPCVAYVSNGISKLFWYDAQQAKQVTDIYPLIRNPRVSLDDKRRFNIGNSDIIFAYQKDDTLCYRVQRERFTIEHVLATNPKKRLLWRIGMGRNNRFLFYWR